MQFSLAIYHIVRYPIGVGGAKEMVTGDQALPSSSTGGRTLPIIGTISFPPIGDGRPTSRTEWIQFRSSVSAGCQRATHD